MKKIFPVFVVCVLSVSVLFAARSTFTTTADNSIDGYPTESDANMGTCTDIRIKNFNQHMVFARFNLASISSNQVSSCSLVVQWTYVGALAGENFEISTIVDNNWVEGTQCSFSATGGSCWNWANYNTVGWLGNSANRAINAFHGNNGSIVNTAYLRNPAAAGLCTTAIDLGLPNQLKAGSASGLGIYYNGSQGENYTIASKERGASTPATLIVNYYTLNNPTSSPCSVYYSVGTSAADLKTGTPTISITTGTATFSTAQTGNIGVGDEITFGGGAKVYITKKNSTTSWNVLSGDGRVPTGVSNEPVVSIKRAFNSLNAALNGAAPGVCNATHLNLGGTPISLITADKKVFVACYADGNDNGGTVSLSAFGAYPTEGCDATHYVQIFTPTSTTTECNQNQRHAGTTASGYTLNITTASADGINIGNSVNYVCILGLIIQGPGASSTGQGVESDISSCLVKNCVITGFQNGVAINRPTPPGINIQNTVIYDCNTYGVSGGSASNSGTVNIFNSTIVACGTGAYANHSDHDYIIRNTVFQNNTTDIGYGGATAADIFVYASILETGTKNFSGADSANQTSVTLSFLDSANNNWLLTGTDAAAVNNGTNLSALASYPFNDDITGAARPVGTAWDIGAHELPNILTLANHDAGQISDQFSETGAQTDMRSFRFKLTPTGASASVSRIAFRLWNIRWLTTADIQNIRLYVDANNNGVLDGGETTVGGTGTADVGAANNIVFSTSFNVSAATNYLLVANFPSLNHTDSIRVGLYTDSITAPTHYKTGTASSVAHKEVQTIKPTRYCAVGGRAAYNTGSVAVANGARIVFGTGTSWLSNNRGRGDSITINGVGYTIDSVTSDTRLVLTENTNATYAGTNYNIARKYATFAAWENQNRNLTAADWNESALLYNDGAEFTAQNIAGWTTNATHTVTVTANPADKHLGKAGTGVTVNCGGGAWQPCQYSRVEWLEIKNGGLFCPRYFNARYNILTGWTGNSGIEFQWNLGNDTAMCNIIYGYQRGIVCGPDQNYYNWVVANNTVFKCDTGIWTGTSSASDVIINNIFWGNGVDMFESYSSGIDANDTNNITGDASANTYGDGTKNYYNISYSQIAFADTAAATRDLHLQGNSYAKDRGSDLSVWLATDIDDSVRSAPWDIGADEIGATLTLANHSAGQETDKFVGTGSATNAELFSFRLTPSTGTASVTQAQFTLSAINGIATGDVTSAAIYVDANNNGAIDGGETTVGGAGTVNITGTTGTITFSSSFNVSAATNYILRASVASLVANDSVTINFSITGITTSYAKAGSATSVKHVERGLALSNHSLGQEPDAFSETGSATNAELFSFRLSPSSGTAAVSQAIIRLTAINGIVTGDVTSAALYVDANNNGAIDGGETAVGGAGAVSIAGTTGTITFSTSFNVSTGTNYILRASVASLGTMDSMNVGLSTTDITAANFGKSGTTTAAAHCERTILTLAEHSAGQETSAFTGLGSATNAELLAFRLSPNAGTASITQVIIRLTVVNGIVSGDVTSAALYVDANNNGAIDGGETAVGGAGVVSIAGTTGTITFSTAIPISAATNYILRANVASLAGNDSLRAGLVTADITTGYTKTGTVSTATHTERALTLANHALGQEPDAFNETGSATNAELFSFRLTPSSSTVSVTQAIIRLTAVNGIVTGDVTSAALYVDANNNGVVDGGETTVGGAGAVNISGTTGSITFSTSFNVSAATNYILRANVANLASMDSMNAGLSTADISVSGFAKSGSATTAAHCERTILTLANSSAGVEPDAFTESGSATNAELVSFRLTPNAGTASITQLVFQLSPVNGIVTGDITSAALYIDANSNGIVDGGETAVGGAGVPSISGTTGTITFSTSFNISAATNYILRANVASLVSMDSMTVSLAVSDIATGYTKTGSATSSAHCERTILTLANHTAGQEADAFHENGGETNAEIFAFRLTPNAGTCAITQLAFSLSNVNGILTGDVTSASLYVDANGNGAIDGGETTVGGSGSVLISGTTGDITFSTSFNLSAATQYILRVNVSALVPNDSMSVSLITGGITTTYSRTGSVSNAAHIERGITLANHTMGQESDAFNESGSATNAELFSFRLTPSSGTATITQVQVQLSAVNGIVTGDVTSASLYVDANSNGAIDGGETTVGGSGNVSIAGTTGTITFSSSFTVGAATNYILRANVANLVSMDSMNVGLGTGNVTVTDYSKSGSTTASSHCERTLLTLADHTAGPEPDAFSETGSASNAELFSFRLTPNAGTAAITQLVVNLSAVNGIVSGDITSASLYVDADNDGTVDGGETTVGGAGAVSIVGTTGTITFSASFNVSAGTNYILRANVSNLATFDSLNAGITTGSITTTYSKTGSASLSAHCERSILTLAEHAAGQETDAFNETGSVTDAELFAFKLTASSGTASITELVVQLPAISGIVTGDVTSAALYVDANNNGIIDGGETTAGGAGTVSIAGTTGTITFSTSFNVTGTVNYIMRASVANLVSNDSLMIGLGTTNLTTSYAKTGSVSSSSHAERTQLTLAEHTIAQETDAFNEQGGVTNAELFAFKLTPNAGTCTITQLVLTLASVNGIATGDVTSVSLYTDANNNGAIDGGDIAVGGSGTPAIAGTTGTITFSTSFNLSAATNYILRASVASLAGNDSMTVGLSTSNITTTYAKNGTVSSATHVERSLALANHPAGQETDAFNEQGGVTDAELFAFQLTPGSGTASVSQLQFQLSAVNGIITGDVTSAALYVDANSNGAIDGGETTVGGTGAVSIAGTAGTITFSTSFNLSSTTSYILRTSVANLAGNDSLVIGLGTGNITTNFAKTGSATSITHCERQITLANHSAGQEPDAFSETGSATNAELFSFRLTPASGTASVTQLVLRFTAINGIVTGDVTAASLYVDANNNGTIDGGETAVGGTGTVNIAGASGTMTFATSFSVSAATNYILRANVANLATMDSMNIGLSTTDITVSNFAKTGSTTAASHCERTILTLAEHTTGQQPDAFGENGGETTAELFSFRLAPNAGTASVSQLVVRLSAVNGIVSGDVTSAAIYVDANNNGAVDGGETTVGGAGVTAIGGATGTITFSTLFTVAAGVNYIVRAAVANLAGGDSCTASLVNADITTNYTKTGSVSSASHNERGLTLANHSAGPAPDVFNESGSVTGGVLLSFRLSPSSGTATVTQLVARLTAINGLVTGDVTSAALYADANNNRIVDGGDVAVGGSGVVAIAGITGTITFNTSIAVSAATDYVLTANVANLVSMDSMTAGLSITDIATAYAKTGSASSSSHIERTILTISEHSIGQETDAFTENGDRTNAELFAFRLSPNAGTATITQAVLRLTAVNGIVSGDMTSAALYVDANNNGAIDGGETAVGGAGVVSIAGATGTVTFPASFTVSAVTNYIMRANVANLISMDSCTIGLSGSDITTTYTKTGTVSSVSHIERTILTLANHSVGQEGDAFTENGDRTNAELFAFRLTPNAGTATITQAILRLTQVNGLVSGDITSVALVVDANNNGTIDGGETAVGGAGVVNIAGTTGTITFSTAFTAGVATNYILQANVANLVSMDSCTLGLSVSDLATTYTKTGTASSVSHIERTILTLAAHSIGQETDAFRENGGETDAELYAFRLSPNAGTATITQAVFRLTTVSGVASGDITAVALYVDANNNGAVDLGETAVGGTGAVSIAGTTGTIIFSTPFALSASTNYILRANAGSLAGGDSMTVGLSASDLTTTYTKTGSVSSVTHTERTLTLADHTVGQVPDAFNETGDQTNARLLAFKLTPAPGAPSITQLVVRLTNMNGIVAGNVTAASLYVDANNNGIVDGGETAVGGTGSVSIGGSVGTITFATPFTVTGATDYVLTASVSSLISMDSMRVSVTASDISIASFARLGSAAIAQHCERTILTLQDHAAGQVSDAFNETGGITNAALFSFGLAPNAGTATLTQTVFRLTAVNGIVSGDITAAAIYIDANNNGIVDGGETTVGGAGVSSIAGTTGTITFSSAITLSTATNYILRASVASLSGNDSMVVSVFSSDITTTYSKTGSISAASHNERTLLTFSTSSAGQESDAFDETGSVTNAELFSFRLEPNVGTATVTQAVFRLTAVRNVVGADITGAALYVDANNNGAIDGGESAVGGTGVVSIAGTTGTITFSTSFVLAAGTDYILRASVANLLSMDSMTVGLSANDITTMYAKTGTVPAVTHVERTILVLIDHGRGQATDAFSEKGSETNAQLMRFQMAANVSSANVTQMVFRLTGINGIVSGDITAASLYIDADHDGEIDGGEATFGGTGSVNIAGTTGTITFSTSHTVSISEDIILAANVGNLADGDSLTVSLYGSDITCTYTGLGTVSSARHREVYAVNVFTISVTDQDTQRVQYVVNSCGAAGSVDSFLIYVNTDSAALKTTFRQLTPSIVRTAADVALCSSADVTGLAENTLYFFGLATRYAGSWSNTVNITRRYTDLRNTLHMDATESVQKGDSSVGVLISGVTNLSANVDSIKVLYAPTLFTTAPASAGPRYKRPQNDTTVTLNGFNGATKYYFTVTAKNNANINGWADIHTPDVVTGNCDTLTTSDYSWPANPIAIGFTGLTDSSVTCTLSAPSLPNIDSIIVYINTDSAALVNNYKTAAGWGRFTTANYRGPHFIHPLIPGASYYLGVAVKSPQNFWCAQSNVVLTQFIASQNNPLSLTLSRVNKDTIRVRFNNLGLVSPSATNIHFYYQTGGYQTDPLAATQGNYTRPFPDSVRIGFAANTDVIYYFSASPGNASGYGDIGGMNEASIWVDNIVPANPLILDVSDSTPVTLTYNVGAGGLAADVDSVWMYRNTNRIALENNFQNASTAADSQPRTSLTNRQLTGLIQCTKYYVGAAPRDRHGNFSTTIKIDSQFTAINNSLSLSVSETGIGRQVRVTIHGIAGLSPKIDTVRLFYQTGNGAFDPRSYGAEVRSYRKDALLADSNVILTNMAALTTYYFAVNEKYFEEVHHFGAFSTANRDTFTSIDYNEPLPRAVNITDSSRTGLQFVIDHPESLETKVQYVYLYVDTSRSRIVNNYRTTAAWDTLTRAEAAALSGIPIPVTGLLEATRYYVGLAVRDNLNWSTSAVIDSTRTPIFNPLAISLAINPTDNRDVVVTFTNRDSLSAMIDSIRMYWQEGLPVTNPFARAPDTVLNNRNMTNVVHVRLPDPTVQYLYFSASPGLRDSDGKSYFGAMSLANADSIMVDSDEPVNPPLGVTILDSGLTAIRLRIDNWQSLYLNTDIKFCYVWVNLDSTFLYLYKTQAESATVSLDSLYAGRDLTLSGLVPGTRYFIGVAPRDTNGNFSNTISIVRAYTASVPPNPLALAGVAPFYHNQINVRVRNANQLRSDITGARLLYRPGGYATDAYDTLVSHIDISLSSSYGDTVVQVLGLNELTRYYFSIATRNTRGYFSAITVPANACSATTIARTDSMAPDLSALVFDANRALVVDSLTELSFQVNNIDAITGKDRDSLVLKACWSESVLYRNFYSNPPAGVRCVDLNPRLSASEARLVRGLLPGSRAPGRQYIFTLCGRDSANNWDTAHVKVDTAYTAVDTVRPINYTAWQVRDSAFTRLKIALPSGFFNNTPGLHDTVVRVGVWVRSSMVTQAAVDSGLPLFSIDSSRFASGLLDTAVLVHNRTYFIGLSPLNHIGLWGRVVAGQSVCTLHVPFDSSTIAQPPNVCSLAVLGTASPELFDISVTLDTTRYRDTVNNITMNISGVEIYYAEGASAPTRATGTLLATMPLNAVNRDSIVRISLPDSLLGRQVTFAAFNASTLSAGYANRWSSSSAGAAVTRSLLDYPDNLLAIDTLFDAAGGNFKSRIVVGWTWEGSVLSEPEAIRFMYRVYNTAADTPLAYNAAGFTSIADIPGDSAGWDTIPNLNQNYRYIVAGYVMNSDSIWSRASVWDTLTTNPSDDTIPPQAMPFTVTDSVLNSKTVLLRWSIDSATFANAMANESDNLSLGIGQSYSGFSAFNNPTNPYTYTLLVPPESLTANGSISVLVDPNTACYFAVAPVDSMGNAALAQAQSMVLTTTMVPEVDSADIAISVQNNRHFIIDWSSAMAAFGSDSLFGSDTFVTHCKIVLNDGSYYQGAMPSDGYVVGSGIVRYMAQTYVLSDMRAVIDTMHLEAGDFYLTMWLLVDNTFESQPVNLGVIRYSLNKPWLDSLHAIQMNDSLVRVTFIPQDSTESQVLLRTTFGLNDPVAVSVMTARSIDTSYINLVRDTLDVGVACTAFVRLNSSELDPARFVGSDAKELTLKFAIDDMVPAVAIVPDSAMFATIVIDRKGPSQASVAINYSRLTDSMRVSISDSAAGDLAMVMWGLDSGATGVVWADTVVCTTRTFSIDTLGSRIHLRLIDSLGNAYDTSWHDFDYVRANFYTNLNTTVPVDNGIVEVYVPETSVKSYLLEYVRPNDYYLWVGRYTIDSTAQYALNSAGFGSIALSQYWFLTELNKASSLDTVYNKVGLNIRVNVDPALYSDTLRFYRLLDNGLLQYVGGSAVYTDSTHAYASLDSFIMYDFWNSVNDPAGPGAQDTYRLVVAVDRVLPSFDTAATSIRFNATQRTGSLVLSARDNTVGMESRLRVFTYNNSGSEITLIDTLVQALVSAQGFDTAVTCTLDFSSRLGSYSDEILANGVYGALWVSDGRQIRLFISTGVQFDSLAGNFSSLNTRWRIVTIPGEVLATGAGSFVNNLTNFSGKYDRDRVRIYRYSSGGSAVEYDKNDARFSVQPGKGFFMITRFADDANVKFKTGTARYAACKNNSGYVLAETPGYHLLAMPFKGFGSRLSSVARVSESDRTGGAAGDPARWKSRIWVLNGSKFDTLTNLNDRLPLASEGGFLVYLFANERLIIPVTDNTQLLPKAVVPHSVKTYSEGKAWSMGLTLRQGGEVVDDFNRFGVRESGIMRLPDLQLPEMKAVAGFTSENGLLAIDERELLNSGNASKGFIWQYEINANADNDFDLGLSGMDNVPEGYLVYLDDLSGKFSVNLQQNKGAYAFCAEKSKPRRFKIVVGDSAFVMAHTFPEAPKLFALGQNYPNPFNPVTTVEFMVPDFTRGTGISKTKLVLDVYNVRGQLIQRLVNEKAHPGYYRVQWSGRDGFNKEVASGLYVYRLAVVDDRGRERFVKTKKMMMLK